MRFAKIPSAFEFNNVQRCNPLAGWDNTRVPSPGELTQWHTRLTVAVKRVAQGECGQAAEQRAR